MRRPLLIAALVLAPVLGTALPRPAAAAELLEPPRPRQGYYFGLGYGFALNKNWENHESWGVWAGTEIKFRFGQMVTRRFGLGLYPENQAGVGTSTGADPVLMVDVVSGCADSGGLRSLGGLLDLEVDPLALFE